MTEVRLFLPFESDHWHSIERFSATLANARELQSDHLQISTFRPSESWNILTPFGARRLAYTVCAPLHSAKLVHIVDPSYSHVRQFLSKSSKVMITCHDLEFWYRRSKKNSAIRKWILKNLLKADLITTPSQIVKEELIQVSKDLRLNTPPIQVVPNACGEEFVPATDRFTLRSQWGFDPKRSLLLNIANTRWPRKNFLFLLKVLTELKDRHPEILLIQVGPAFQPEILDFIREKNLGNFIHRFENLSKEKIVELYQMSDAFLHPSLYEGFGYPLLESAGCGTAFLASDIPVFKELFSDETFLLKLEADLWASTVSKILSEASFKNSILEKQKNLLSRYSKPVQISAFKKIYEELGED